MYGLVFSEKDPAGKGMAEYIIGRLSPEKTDECRRATRCYRGDNYYIAGYMEDEIYFEFLDEDMPKSIVSYIFLSRHSSAKQVKSYTVHHTGNFGDEAPYGGKPRTLSIANPVVSHKLLLLLREKAEEYNRIGEYEVSYEATHHGPTGLRKPLSFIEIGSTIDEWKDPVNHEVVGETIISFLKDPRHECIPVIGIGGGHYPRKHTAKALKDGYCYGHIMAKYALPYLTEEMIDQMIIKSDPRPVRIVVEKKGTRKEHRVIIQNYSKSHALPVEYL
jgi:D-aminoacyl-tRNA deacylase